MKDRIWFVIKFTFSMMLMMASIHVIMLGWGSCVFLWWLFTGREGANDLLFKPLDFMIGLPYSGKHKEW